MPFTRLRYHIVMATKYRKPWITADIESFLYPVLGHITTRIGGKLIGIGGIEDHVHMVSAYPPKLSVSQFIERLKVESTGALKRHRRDLWNFGWGVGYGCFTLDSRNLSGIIDYVKNQKIHHAEDNLRDPYECYDTRGF